MLAYGFLDTIYVAKGNGTEAHELLKVDGVPFAICWSPDGERLRFSLRDLKNKATSLWEVKANGTQLHPVLPGWNNPPSECCGSWTPDGNYYVFQAGRNGTTQIWAFRERRGLFHEGERSPVQLTSGPMGSFEPVPSRDGKRIFFQGNQQRGELIKFDLKSKQFVRYLSGLSAEHLHFSKDGEWIAYITYPEGSLWRCKRDGSQKLQLSFPPVRAVLPRWSPDGRTIAFTDREKAPITADIYVVALEGGQPQKLSILPQLSRKVGPSWSPDGNELAFEAGIRQVGRTAIYLLDRKRNEVTKLLGSDGFSSPTWSPDGRFISARPSNEAENFALFEFATQKWIELDMVKGWWSWSRTGKYIYFADYSGKSLARVDVDSRRVERLASLEGLQFVDDGFGTWMALTPDDCPLFLRDVGSQDIYALDWEAP